MVLINGCATTSGPTSNVGIINGKYAVQTTVPNNNKGKKVNLTFGQSYSCKNTFTGNDGKTNKVTFDLKTSKDGKSITWHNDKVNGKTSEGYYVGKLVFKPGKGFVETTKGKQAILLSQNNSGEIGIFKNVREREKFTKLNQRFKNGQIIKSEYDLRLKKIKAYTSSCTQTTNNTYSSSRYLTNHEIDAYKHGQQIAVQQRSIDSANYNATMARIQNQNAQTNYNTQQMLNRMNTYNVKIY